MVDLQPFPSGLAAGLAGQDLGAALGAVVQSVTGERLRKLRDAAGLSQAALAEAAGCSQQTISNVERGTRPVAETALRIWQALASRQRLKGEAALG